MKMRHEPAILRLFAALKENDAEERGSLYDSLAVLVHDLDAFFVERTSNADYMKEKAGLFIEACEIVAGLAEPPGSLEESVAYAEGNLLKLRSLAQWK